MTLSTRMIDTVLVQYNEKVQAFTRMNVSRSSSPHAQAQDDVLYEVEDERFLLLLLADLSPLFSFSIFQT